MLRVELQVPLCQRRNSPRINQFFPYPAGHFLLERVIVDQFETIKLVRPVLQVGSTVGIQVVVNQDAVLVAIILFKVLGQFIGYRLPGFRM